MDRVQFIGVEDEEQDLVLSFALDDECGVKSLILQRTPALEVLLSEYERGVQVSMEGDEYLENNLLKEIAIKEEIVVISALQRSYKLSISQVENEELQEMLKFIDKLNFDSSFKVSIA